MSKKKTDKPVSKLSRKRARKLCARTVEHIASIDSLLAIGFTPEELIDVYGYDAESVRKYQA